MRTNVIFRHPAEYLPRSEEDGILAAGGAQWFATILRRVPGLEIDADLCQEDWGVVLLARRNGKKFWIGLSAWDAEGAWLAHFHHGSLAWFQRFSSSGESALKRLLADVDKVLACEAAISDIVWHDQFEVFDSQPPDCPAPVHGDPGAKDERQYPRSKGRRSAQPRSHRDA
jgi:hypothetical protein